MTVKGSTTENKEIRRKINRDDSEKEIRRPRSRLRSRSSSRTHKKEYTREGSRRRSRSSRRRRYKRRSRSISRRKYSSGGVTKKVDIKKSSAQKQDVSNSPAKSSKSVGETTRIGVKKNSKLDTSSDTSTMIKKRLAKIEFLQSRYKVRENLKKYIAAVIQDIKENTGGEKDLDPVRIEKVKVQRLRLQRLKRQMAKVTGTLLERDFSEKTGSSTTKTKAVKSNAVISARSSSLQTDVKSKDDFSKTSKSSENKKSSPVEKSAVPIEDRNIHNPKTPEKVPVEKKTSSKNLQKEQSTVVSQTSKITETQKEESQIGKGLKVSENVAVTEKPKSPEKSCSATVLIESSDEEENKANSLKTGPDENTSSSKTSKKEINMDVVQTAANSESGKDSQITESIGSGKVVEAESFEGSKSPSAPAEKHSILVQSSNEENIKTASTEKITSDNTRCSSDAEKDDGRPTKANSEVTENRIAEKSSDKEQESRMKEISFTESAGKPLFATTDSSINENSAECSKKKLPGNLKRERKLIIHLTNIDCQNPELAKTFGYGKALKDESIHHQQIDKMKQGVPSADERKRKLHTDKTLVVRLQRFPFKEGEDFNSLKKTMFRPRRFSKQKLQLKRRQILHVSETADIAEAKVVKEDSRIEKSLSDEPINKSAPFKETIIIEGSSDEETTDCTLDETTNTADILNIDSTEKKENTKDKDKKFDEKVKSDSEKPENISQNRIGSEEAKVSDERTNSTDEKVSSNISSEEVNSNIDAVSTDRISSNLKESDVCSGKTLNPEENQPVENVFKEHQVKLRPRTEMNKMLNKNDEKNSKSEADKIEKSNISKTTPKTQQEIIFLDESSDEETSTSTASFIAKKSLDIIILDDSSGEEAENSNVKKRVEVSTNDGELDKDGCADTEGNTAATNKITDEKTVSQKDIEKSEQKSALDSLIPSNEIRHVSESTIAKKSEENDVEKEATPKMLLSEDKNKIFEKQNISSEKSDISEQVIVIESNRVETLLEKKKSEGISTLEANRDNSSNETGKPDSIYQVETREITLVTKEMTSPIEDVFIKGTSITEVSVSETEKEEEGCVVNTKDVTSSIQKSLLKEVKSSIINIGILEPNKDLGNESGKNSVGTNISVSESTKSEVNTKQKTSQALPENQVAAEDSKSLSVEETDNITSQNSIISTKTQINPRKNTGEPKNADIELPDATEERNPNIPSSTKPGEKSDLEEEINSNTVDVNAKESTAVIESIDTTESNNVVVPAENISEDTNRLNENISGESTKFDVNTKSDDSSKISTEIKISEETNKSECTLEKECLEITGDADTADVASRTTKFNEKPEEPNKSKSNETIPRDKDAKIKPSGNTKDSTLEITIKSYELSVLNICHTVPQEKTTTVTEINNPDDKTTSINNPEITKNDNDQLILNEIVSEDSTKSVEKPDVQTKSNSSKETPIETVGKDTQTSVKFKPTHTGECTSAMNSDKKTIDNPSVCAKSTSETETKLGENDDEEDGTEEEVEGQELKPSSSTETIDKTEIITVPGGPAKAESMMIDIDVSTATTADSEKTSDKYKTIIEQSSKEEKKPDSDS